MKRVIISLALLAVCIGVSLYASHRVKEVYRRVEEDVSAALDAIAEADEARVEECVKSLSSYWDEEEDRLIRFLRHAQIDEITQCVSRLHALALGGDYSELTAELATIRWKMEHIHRSERLIFANLL